MQNTVHYPKLQTTCWHLLYHLRCKLLTFAFNMLLIISNKARNNKHKLICAEIKIKRLLLV